MSGANMAAGIGFGFMKAWLLNSKVDMVDEARKKFLAMKGKVGAGASGNTTHPEPGDSDVEGGVPERTSNHHTIPTPLVPIIQPINDPPSHQSTIPTINHDGTPPISISLRANPEFARRPLPDSISLKFVSPCWGVLTTCSTAPLVS